MAAKRKPAGAIGVLGGMGPMATVDFLAKVIELTPASRDQDHLPLIVYSVPQVPDRSASIVEGRESPLPAMIEGLRTLVRAGVECIAIPCNTAHHWYDGLARESSVPVLHMVDAAGAAMQRLGVPDGPVGLLATAGTLAAGIYPARLVRHGYECVVPDNGDVETLVTPGIGLVKAGRVAEAEELLRTAADNLLGRGARVVILACTEIPVALKDDDASEGCYVDATRALAESCVRWFRGKDRPPPGAREKRQRQNA